MVGVFVNDDVVVIPKPVVAESDVIWGDTEVKAAEPETVWASAAEMPDVATAESAGEASVLPGMVEVVVRIVAAGIVANPFAVGVNVWRVGMASLVVEVRVFRGRMRCARRFRTAGGDMGGSAADLTAMLGQG